VFECVVSGLASENCTQNAGGPAADGSPYAGLFQMVRVTSITSGTCSDAAPCTAGISPPIHMPNWGAQATRAWWQDESSITGVGVEDLQLYGPNPTLGFRWATQSWARNVEQLGTSAAPHYVLVNHTVGITYRDSYIFGPGNWSDEYAGDCSSAVEL
jgi:hypothetical protein